MKKSLLTFIAALVLANSPAEAAVPLSYTHHGVLKESGALVNGMREITVQIVDDLGQVVGSKSATVKVESGAYTMEIDNIDSGLVAAATALHLQVTVDGEAMAPALKINAVPYATVAQQTKSLNTTGQLASGMYRYVKDGDIQNDLTIAATEHCPCDKSDNSWDCGDDFEETALFSAGCYDVYGSGYQYYRREIVVRPLEVVAIESAMVGIGTAQPEAPLHILSDSGESGEADLKIAGPNPTIMFDDMDGQKLAVRADNGTLQVGGAINATGIGSDLLARIYPVGSVYISMTLSTAAAVATALGGEWERLPDDFFLQSASSGANDKVSACLPNITGYVGAPRNEVDMVNTGDYNSALYFEGTGRADGNSGDTRQRIAGLKFDASRSNSLYNSNCTTVQPAAIKVYMFKRVK